MKLINWLFLLFKRRQINGIKSKWCSRNVKVVNGDNTGKKGRVIAYFPKTGAVCIMRGKLMFMDHENNIEERWFN